MKKRNIAIILLLLIGIVLTMGTLYGKRIITKKDKLDERKQYNAFTQRLDTIMPYKNKYMGDSSNTLNLFHHLPLAINDKEFQMYPDELTLEIHYKTSSSEAGAQNCEYVTGKSLKKLDRERIGTKETTQALIYNSTAAFALIDNLERIIFRFSDRSYTITRQDVESKIGDLHSILTHRRWKQFQKKLSNEKVVEDLAESILIKQ